MNSVQWIMKAADTVVNQLEAENKALKLELHKVRCDYNRLEEQYKLLIDELQCLKE